MTKTYQVFRDGQKPIQEHIKAAVTAFYSERGKLPAAMIVHKTEAAAAVTALASLDLAMELKGSGGCLVGELWLETSNSNKQPVLQQGQLDLEVSDD